MLFNSIEFLIFFPVVFFIYWFALKDQLRLQNLFLLIASCVFYMAFIPVYILILLVTILIDYFAALYIEKAEGKRKKYYLVISIISTCLVLFVFKYFNFFNTNFREIAGLFHLNYPIGIVNIILPIGLSFHTFQSLSYVIEVYRGDQKAEHNFLTYSLYVMFFPQLVAGPIERPQHLLPQFNSKRHFDYALASSGAKLILLGYFKKVAIADNIAPVVNAAYNHPAEYSGFPMAIATLFFAFQVYCDFSGYSDIAIGIARLLGFKLMTNFDHPYFSKSVTEFWRRWHISLSSWFRDYLYTPIAFARRDWGIAGIVFSLLLTFLIVGLWHGAGWTFIVFGFIHGAALSYEVTTIRFRKKMSRSLPAFFYNGVSTLLTFSFVCFTMIFFRANNLSDALLIIKNIFSVSNSYFDIGKTSVEFRKTGLNTKNFTEPLLFIFFLGFIEFGEKKEILSNIFLRMPILKWSFYCLLLTVTVFWGFENKAENFIYFQF